MRRLLLAALLAWGFAAHADNTSSGHSFTPPESFTVSATGPLLRLTAPEGDANPSADGSQPCACATLAATPERHGCAHFNGC